MTSALTSTPPIARGRFGPYGGQYVPETIMPALEELDTGFQRPSTMPVASPNASAQAQSG
jgi:tryptophan synthase beta subunit